MRYDWEGMSLWFEPNEIASDRTILLGTEVTITVGVEPADASNRVEVRYRVNGGPTAITAADPVRHARNAQYFRVHLPAPAFRAGDIVEYTALCRCAGRQVPSPEEAEHFALTFRVVEDGATGTPDHSAQDGASLHAPRNMASPGLPATARIGAAASALPLDLAVEPVPMTHLNQAMFVVCGQVQANGSPVGGVRIRASDKDLRREQLLGETATNEDGRYEIHYTAEQFPQAKRRHANLLVRAFNVAGVELGASEITFNAPATATIDLAITRTDDVQPSEYNRLLSVLTPFLGDVALADLTDDDVTFLTQATQIDRPLLELLRQSARLGVQTRLPAEAFFGFGRTGLALDLETLVAFQNNGLRHAITAAVDKKIVPKTLQEQSDNLIRRLKRYNYVPHYAAGQVLNQQTGAPLAGFRVHVFDLNAGGDPEALGSVTTNGKGTFTFTYAAPPTKPVNSTMLQFLCKISDAKGQALAEHKVQIEPGQTDVVEVRIAVPAPQVAPSPTITHLSSTLALSIPTELQSYLSKRNISTLEDIRSTGGLARLMELPVAPDHPAVQMLEAHADLSHLSSDLQFNALLISKGFTSVAAIADTPRANFVAAAHETIGDFKAAQLHVMARAQTAFLDNVLAGAAAEQANGFSVHGTMASGNLPFAEKCTCEDCESAVSPAMYLADLLNFAVHSINSGQIDVKFLADTLHQPFDALSVSCEAVTRQVRQVRICVEVLRSYLGARPLADLSEEAALEKAEGDYLVSAYTSLLTQIGTSYEEIRLARSASEDQRKALADRLGIELTTPRPATGDELDRLFLNVPVTLGTPNTLDQLKALEQGIEQLFGLADTRRDPLSDGAKYGDDPNTPRITRWNFDRVEWGRHTDPDGNIYVTQENPSPGIVNLTLYRDAQRTQPPVASSKPGSSAGQVLLSPLNSSDLSGTFEVTSTAPSSTIYISAVPNFLSWRLKHLRTTWAQQDRPADPYTAGELPQSTPGVVTVLPIIDPDLIGPDDFRSPVPKASAAASATAFDLWLARRGEIDGILRTLQRNRETNADGLTGILKNVFGDPLPNFDSLLQDLTQGDDTAVKKAKDAIAKLNLTVDSFTRLMELRTKDAQSRGGPGEPVSPDEWREVYSILTQALKVQLFSSWRNQEQQSKIILGIQDFWISLREPAEGDWPVPSSSGVPLIDPDLVTLKDLPEPVAGEQAIKLWTDRSAQLQAKTAQLATTQQSSDFDSMIKLALGDPLPHDLDALRKDLASSNAATVDAAQKAIINDLHLTLDGFGRLMTIRDKDAQADKSKKPTAAEYAEVYAILTKAWKIGTAYKQWTTDEQTAFAAEAQAAGEPNGQIAYWRARKAALPRWRASAEARQAWQQALRARSAPPIIDPDLVRDEDLRDLVKDNAAYQLWTERDADITKQHDTIAATQRTKAALDPLFQQYLGVKADDLIALDGQRSNGHGIQSRLDQLNLTNAAFNTLLRVWTLLDKNQPILDAEWESVASILVQAFKLRQFAMWRIKEQQQEVILEPDLFQIPPPPSDVLLPIAPKQLPAWRATQDAWRAWQDTLQSRIDAQDSVIAGMRDAVSATENSTLEQLRDGLIMATQASGSDLDSAANWVTKRFFVDAKVDACQTTTRVEQAIETVQELLLSLSKEPLELSGFESAGAVAAVNGSDGIHLFARGADDALWHTRQDGNAWQDPWQEWESLGDVITSDPAACIHNGKLEVFARRHDNAVWRKTFDNGQWSDWESLGGLASSAPAAVSWGGDHLEVVVRWTDGPIYHKRFENGQWTDWQNPTPGLGIFASGPTISSRGMQQLEVFALGLDNAIWYLVYDQNWQTWQRLGGVWNSSPSAFAPGPLFTYVYVRGTDDLLYEWLFEPNVPSGPGSHPGISLTSAPAVCLSGGSMPVVFVRGGDYRLWRLLVADWAPIGPAPLTLTADNFKEQWKWLGSYATWRAAILVWLYPESLLLPTLRPENQQTPSFKTLVQTLSAGGSVTSEAACKAAQAYAAYFNDISNLWVEATCQTSTPVYNQDRCGNRTSSEWRYIFYMFARKATNKKVYWSSYDPTLGEQGYGYAQSFWTEIELSGQTQSEEANAKSSNPPAALENVSHIIGAVPFVTPEKRYICLFVQTQEVDRQTLRLVKLDIETQVWDSGIEVKPPAPENVAIHDAIIKQDDHESTRPPYVVIRLSNGHTYGAALNSTGTGWADKMDQLPIPTAYVIFSMAWFGSPQVEDNFLTSLRIGKSSEPSLSVTWGLTGFEPLPFNADRPFHGLIWLPMTSSMRNVATGPLKDQDRAYFGFVEDSGGSRHTWSSLLESGSYPGIQEIEYVVPTAGEVDYNISARQFVYQGKSVQSFAGISQSQRRRVPLEATRVVRLGGGGQQRGGGFFAPPCFRCTFTWSESGLSLPASNLVALNLTDPSDPTDIPSELSASALKVRRQQIKAVMLKHDGLAASLHTYLEEAYYFVPIHLALQLHRGGEYEAALACFRTVYDYTAPKGDERKIYYGLKQEESLPEIYKRPDNWLSDPLNPHAIARTRGNSYTRFTLLSIIRCLLDYGDSEFSHDTGESLARARTLYQTALDLLDTDELKQHLHLGDCPSIIGTLVPNDDSSPTTSALFTQIKLRLLRISDRAALRDTVTRIHEVLKRDEPADQRWRKARELAASAAAESSRPQPLGAVIEQADAMRKRLYLSALSSPALGAAIQRVRDVAGGDFMHAVAGVTGLASERLQGDPIELPWLRGLAESLGAPQSLGGASGDNPLIDVDAAREFQVSYVPSTLPLWGCIPQNPVLNTLRLHAELNLRKLKSCRNIAGMKREIEPYAAPTNTTSALPAIGAGGQLILPGTVSIQPTLYHYRVLVERAKQLVQLASQVEASMLSAIEKGVNEQYNLRKAQQDLGLAQAGVQLQQSRLTEAQDGVKLAKTQRHKAEIQRDHYTTLLEDKELKEQEQNVIDGLQSARDHLNTAQSMGLVGGGFGIASAILSGAAALAAIPGGPILSGILGGAGPALNTLAAYNATQAQIDAYSSQIASAIVSMEVTRGEWEFQKALANQDLDIGCDQITVANDRVTVAQQEVTIANLQVTNATDTIEFLTNKFTNVDLYEWMSGVLEGVYRFFLQQASVMARLAQNQLAFERQETPPAFIQADYWALPSSQANTATNASRSDRRGLTGSERLLQDIYELDQYAFQTDKRKLQLSKPLSLARLAPAEFQRFRETGTLVFATPMEIFDRDFPGHYLRLIKRVSTSVVALIPPTQGIQATLLSTGISRVVIGGDIFQTVPIRRDPQYVALTSPIGATGVFQLDAQSDMLLPFEGTGVHASWEFSLPKAANAFDYSSIADVLITIEYTALNSFDYRDQVIRTLSSDISTDRAYSFRNDLQDQWYDLHNPDQTSTPMTVRFTTLRQDFPPNIDDLRIQQVLLYFSRADGQIFEVPVTSLRFTDQGGTGSVGGGATSIDGVISTRRGNAGSWTAMIGKAPFGDWELVLQQTDEMKDRFNNEDITDILFVITYSGRTPEWPS